jgi:hypothetical protein
MAIMNNITFFSAVKNSGLTFFVAINFTTLKIIKFFELV